MKRFALGLGVLLAFGSGFALSACQRRYPGDIATVRLEPGHYRVQSNQDWLSGATLLIREPARSIRIEWPSKDLDGPYLEAALLENPE